MPPLTIVIATRNRPCLCAALVRFLRGQGVEHRIIVADSSDAAERAVLQSACGAAAEILSFAPDIYLMDKLAAAIEATQTPFVALLPDDDIPLPHAMERCLAHLVAHPEATAAQGYVLDLGLHPGVLDLLSVRWFVPSIDHPDPLQRLYHLVRRYQPFFWSVFRRDALIAALRRARMPQLICFQEMTFMAVLVLLGTFARLPCVFMLRGVEETLTSIVQIHPFHALLADSEGFFTHYGVYRDGLDAFIDASVPHPSLASAERRHMLNLIHAIFFRPELDGGPMEYAVQRLFDPTMRAPTVPPIKAELSELGRHDLMLQSSRKTRRYIWRHQLLHAEPRDEITIDAEECARVITALDGYDPPSP